ncbi:MAG TPA: carboxymuconolactone decarboxylase family protein [Casimicrobiaceae bacterium]|jgi:alkyl hydroperoxide reductase subunit D
MDSLQTIKERLPAHAKDVKLNLDAVLFRGSLPPPDALGAALAAAFAAKSPELIQAFRENDALDSQHAEAALTAASLMAMNNVWYPFVEMADDPELATMRAELRMNAYATHGGVDRRSFELYALAASIVGKCSFCVKSHYKLLRDSGMTSQQLRDVGRIAAVVAAAAQALANAEQTVAAAAA